MLCLDGRVDDGERRKNSLCSFILASPSFSTNDMGFTSSPVDTNTTTGRQVPWRGQNETKKAKERRSNDDGNQKTRYAAVKMSQTTMKWLTYMTLASCIMGFTRHGAKESHGKRERVAHARWLGK